MYRMYRQSLKIRLERGCCPVKLVSSWSGEKKLSNSHMYSCGGGSARGCTYVGSNSTNH